MAKFIRSHAIHAWFEKMQTGCKYITQVELEGERGDVKPA